MSAQIKAVGFDLDGTLFETHVDYDSLNDCDRVVLERHGIPFREVFGDDPDRKRLRAPIREWLADNGRSDEFDAIYREIDELSLYYEEQFVSDAKEYPRSIECIRYLRSKGLKVGLLTRGGYRYAETVLKRFGIFDDMDAIVGRDHSFHDNCKPSHVAMEEFADELGVGPDEILYVGDNMTDYLSAHGAGSTFIGVLSGAGSAEMWRSVSPSIETVEHAGDIMDIIDRFL
ncbi:MAG: HAD family hydrolase [Candidatus Methanomethylophilaceae archaeon]